MKDQFGKISVVDRSIRKVTGDEHPKGLIPGISGDGCVTSDHPDVPEACAECSYFRNEKYGHGLRQDANDPFSVERYVDGVYCTHPQAPGEKTRIAEHIAECSIPNWCPRLAGTMS